MEQRASIHIAVKQVAVEGQGAILLTGPSSCGKGEVAKSLRHFLSLRPELHLSMGDLLRSTIETARQDADFRRRLGMHYRISDQVSVLDPDKNDAGLIEKVTRYRAMIAGEMNGREKDFSQLDWLDFCVREGLLVPDEWAERIIDARLREFTDLRDEIFILDGYPRTTKAAEKLLHSFAELDIGVIKVLHLSITKEEMKSRARTRGREDDIDEVLDRRYEFYVEKVQPCIDYLKFKLGTERVALIDAHQPVFRADGALDRDRSIRAVTISVMEALGLPRFLLDLDDPGTQGQR